MALHSTNRFGSAVDPALQDSVESHTSHKESLPSPGFFRSPSIFKALKKIVYPGILKHRLPGSPVRIWVLGCSSGETVYSIAVSLVEFLGTRAAASAIRIFGTDINEDAIRIARRGRFGTGISVGVSMERLSRFFTPINGGYEVSPAVRDLCIFATHDVANDPPFSHLDLLVFGSLSRCSQAGSQRSLVSALHVALKPHGFLVLAGGTKIDSIEKLFVQKDAKSMLYERKDIGRRERFETWLLPKREMFWPIPSSGDETPQPHRPKRGARSNSREKRRADDHHLQQAIETNWQLCSRNREILSSHIELQSTAEDLQTRNYELHRAAGESEEKCRVFVENATVAGRLA